MSSNLIPCNPAKDELMSTFHGATSVRIKCIAEKGMLSHEASVLIRGVDQCYESMLDTELVSLEGGGAIDDKEQVGWIVAGVVKANGEKILVELPRQVVAGGRRIWVPISEVK